MHEDWGGGGSSFLFFQNHTKPVFLNGAVTVRKHYYEIQTMSSALFWWKFCTANEDGILLGILTAKKLVLQVRTISTTTSWSCLLPTACRENSMGSNKWRTKRCPRSSRIESRFHMFSRCVLRCRITSDFFWAKQCGYWKTPRRCLKRGFPNSCFPCTRCLKRWFHSVPKEKVNFFRSPWISP